MKTSRDTTTNLNSRGRGRGARADRGSRGARGSSRGANATGSRSNVVASAGLFSEGAGDGTSKRLLSRFRSTDVTEASTLRRPTINKKERADPILEQKHMNEIYDLDDDPTQEGPLLNDNFGPINLIECK